MDILDQAIVFAVEAHSGTNRKGGNIPYILHPLEAAAIVGSMTADREIMAAAVLHDVVEDTGITVEEIQSRFGVRIAEIVAAESENKREGLPAQETWELRKKETLAHLAAETDAAVKMVALGDKLSNIRAMYRDQKMIGGCLWERFNEKDPKKHGWYYREMARALSELKEYPAWQEYNRLVEMTFEDYV